MKFSTLEIKRLPWWIRLQLYFCKMRVAVDPAYMDRVGSCMYYKILKGKVYVVKLKILRPEKGAGKL